jgi:hypothetical protein
MQTFTYPLFFRLIYRYGNIPVTVIFLIYLVPAVLFLDKNFLYMIPIAALLLLIYYTNRRYLYLYKIIPYKITADDEKMYCTDFIFSKREVIIYFNDIASLKGGIFEGKLNGLMLVNDGRNKVNIGFYPRLKMGKDLQKFILNRVNKPVYDEVLEKINKRNKKD